MPQHYRRETLAVASTVDEVPDAAAIVAGRGGDAAAANAGVEEDLDAERGLSEHAESPMSPNLEVVLIHDLRSGKALLYGFSGYALL